MLEFAAIAAKKDFVVARVTASSEMLDEIIQVIQKNGAEFIPSSKTKVRGVSAGALGFSFGLTFNNVTEEQFGFRVKLEMLSDELAKHGKAILILVDEVQSNSPEMRILATTYQHLIGENKNLVIAMAGLPDSMSAVLNDDILTFLNRAYKVYLEPLPYGEISIAYENEFTRQGKSIDPETLGQVVLATRGYPYLFQLIGYYTLAYAGSTDVITSQIAEKAIFSSKHDLVESIFTAALKPLSDGDMRFIKAMAQDKESSRIKDIKDRLKVSQSHAQKYRTRLIGAGIIAPVKRGELALVIPFLEEYLRGEFWGSAEVLPKYCRSIACMTCCNNNDFLFILIYNTPL